MSAPAARAPGKLPFVVWVLAAGTFLMGTTEFVMPASSRTSPPTSAPASPTPAC